MDYGKRNYSDLRPPLRNVKRQPKWVVLTVMKLLLRICAVSSSNWKHFPILVWNSLFHLLLSPSDCHFWWITIFLHKNILQNTAAYLSLLISQEGAKTKFEPASLIIKKKKKNPRRQCIHTDLKVLHCRGPIRVKCSTTSVKIISLSYRHCIFESFSIAFALSETWSFALKS